MRALAPCDHVNAYLWHKLGFSRSGLPAVERARRQIGFYGATPMWYLSLLARVERFEFRDLDRALYDRRTLVRGRAMRETLFLVPVEWLPMTIQATRESVCASFLPILKGYGLSPEDYEASARAVEQALRAEITPPELANGPAVPFILSLMHAEGRLVRATVRGGWKSHLFEYARLEDWLPGVDLTGLTPEGARSDLARANFETYGPAVPVPSQGDRGGTALSQERDPVG